MVKFEVLLGDKNVCFKLLNSIEKTSYELGMHMLIGPRVII